MLTVDTDSATNEFAAKLSVIGDSDGAVRPLENRAQTMLDTSEGIQTGLGCLTQLRDLVNRIYDVVQAVLEADADPAIPANDGPSTSVPGIPAAGTSGAASTGRGRGPGGSGSSGPSGSSGNGQRTGGGPLTPQEPKDPKKEADKIRQKYGVLHPEDCPCVFHTEAYRTAFNGLWISAWPTDPVIDWGSDSRSVPLTSPRPTTTNGIAEGGCYPPFPDPIKDRTKNLPPHPSNCPCPYHVTGSYPTPSGPVPFPPNGPLNPNWENKLPDPKELPTEHADGSATDPWPDGFLLDSVVGRPIPLPPIYFVLREREMQLETKLKTTDGEIAAVKEKRDEITTKIGALNSTAAGLRSARQLLVAQGAPAESIAAVDEALKKVDEQRSPLVEERSKLADELTQLQNTKTETNAELEKVRDEMAEISEPTSMNELLRNDTGGTSGGGQLTESNTFVAYEADDSRFSRLREPLAETNSVAGTRSGESEAASQSVAGEFLGDVKYDMQREAI